MNKKSFFFGFFLSVFICCLIIFGFYCFLMLGSRVGVVPHAGDIAIRGEVTSVSEDMILVSNCFADERNSFSREANGWVEEAMGESISDVRFCYHAALENDLLFSVGDTVVLTYNGETNFEGFFVDRDGDVYFLSDNWSIHRY